jgi:hypothetical protein
LGRETCAYKRLNFGGLPTVLRRVSEAPAFVSGLHDIAVMREAIEEGGGHLRIAEDARRFVDRFVVTIIEVRLRTVFRDIFRSRAISLIDLPFDKCSRRIRPIVSTISIPQRPLQSKAGRPTDQYEGVNFGRRSPG